MYQALDLIHISAFFVVPTALHFQKMQTIQFITALQCSLKKNLIQQVACA